MKLFAQDLAIIVIYEAEAVSVVGCTKIIPYAIGNVPILDNGDHIAHPILAPFKLSVADRSKLSAPENFVGMLIDKFLDGC